MKMHGTTPEGRLVGKKAYLAAWDALIEQLERRLSVRVIAFDPHLQVIDAAAHATGNWGNSSQMPLWLVRKILEDRPWVQ